MPERLPVQLDPVALADRGRDLAGRVPIASFERLGGALHSHEGEIEARLHFGHDDQGRRILTGSLAGALQLECQRCLSPYALPIDLELALILVDSDSEAETLPEELDALVVGERRSMHTVDMLEDDLILALPIVPRCASEAHCKPAVELLDSESLESGTDESRQNPFAVLADERH